MSVATLILGESGTGKTASIRSLHPLQSLLIQPVRKALSFKADGWSEWGSKNPNGNIHFTDDADRIVTLISKTTRPIIIVDDFQYTMSNEFMRRVLDKETGNQSFAKYNEIARHAWDVLNAANNAEPWKRVYILSHTQIDDNGRIKIKTIGKLLDEKITIEGMVTTVLRTAVVNKNYVFVTQNNGMDTTKSPMGMFDTEHIPNDLAEVDQAICTYYNITQPAKEPAQ